MGFNIWDDANKLVKDIYQSDNYEIEMLNPDSKLCAIACSSNGLYYPDNYETFSNVIIHNNRYEWKNIFKNPKVKKKYGKVIYIRDVYKQWYVTGINQRIQSVDNLVEWIIEKTEGYEVVTLGNSAGGYIATIIGILIGARTVYNFSGQFSIWDGAVYSFLKKYSGDSNRNKYYNITEYIQKSIVPVMYFYPGKVEEDQNQFMLIKNFENVYTFSLDENQHGKTIYGINYPYVLCMDNDKLVKLCNYYDGRAIKRVDFLYKTAGIVGGTKALIKKVLCRH